MRILREVLNREASPWTEAVVLAWIAVALVLSLASCTTHEVLTPSSDCWLTFEAGETVRIPVDELLDCEVVAIEVVCP